MVQDGTLNAVEYAELICRELGWPASGNQKLIAECITAIAFQKKISVEDGFCYLVAKIRMAKTQGIKVNRWFFQDGKYHDVKAENMPRGKTARPTKSKQRESEGNGN